MAEELVGGSVRLEESEAAVNERDPEIDLAAEPRYGFHTGTSPDVGTYVENGLYHCTFVKTLTNLTELGPDDGGTVVIAGSHKVKCDRETIIAAAYEDPALIHQVVAPAGSTLLFGEAPDPRHRPDPLRPRARHRHRRLYPADVPGLERPRAERRIHRPNARTPQAAHCRQRQVELAATPSPPRHAGRFVIQLAPPYLLFLGDAADQLAAKTAVGVAQWRPEQCIGQLRLPDCHADLGLPEQTLAEARAAGARTLIIGVANRGGTISDLWRETFLQAHRPRLRSRQRPAHASWHHPRRGRPRPRKGHSPRGCALFRPRFSHCNRRQTPGQTPAHRRHRLLGRQDVHRAGH